MAKNRLSFWDHELHLYRRSRVLLALIFSLGILFWVLLGKKETPRVSHTQRVLAEVVEVKSYTTGGWPTRFGKAEKMRLYRVVLKLPEGERVRISATTVPLRVGQRVPLYIDYLEGGERRFRYDRIEWLTETLDTP